MFILQIPRLSDVQCFHLYETVILKQELVNKIKDMYFIPVFFSSFLKLSMCFEDNTGTSVKLNFMIFQ